MADTVDTGIKIYDRHDPVLTAGYYKIEINQEFGIVNSPALQDEYTAELIFKVAAEQFSISPQLVNAVFPPADALGDFSTVLPNIILNRSTFAWERKAAKDGTAPWLALLLFSEDELTTKGALPQDLAKLFFTDVDASDKNTSPILYLRIGDDLWNGIKPGYEELSYLAHVRGKPGDERAVIAGNRLPFKNKRNFVHLISVEEKYDSSSGFIGEAESNGCYSLISLYNWEFFCSENFIVTPELIGTFKDDEDNKVHYALSGLVNNKYLDSKDFIDAITEKINNSEETSTETIKISTTTQDDVLKTFEVSHLNQILRHLNRTPATLQLLRQEDNLSKAGYLQVPYVLKNGDKINGAYRGPLIPFKPVAGNTIEPILSSDTLFNFINNGDDIVDISYAAAWELGRLLALADKNFSTALFLWKRACYQSDKINPGNTAYPAMPEPVRAWFNDLVLLKNVPFNYLVPSEDYLPFESIRFFCIDPNWINSLTDGAFSIGRLSKNDKDIDTKIYSNKSPALIDIELYKKQNPDAATITQNPVSGFLLRSRAASGWPDMVIEGIANAAAANMVKTELSSNLFFCSFDALIDTFVLYQKPESIHFGFEEDEDGKLCLYSNGKKVVVEVNSDNNKVGIKPLYDNIQAANIPAFAKCLIQKTEEVIFSFSS